MSAAVWFPYRVPRPGAALRLFCFPPAGRGASAYRGWQDRLPGHVEVWPVQLPGREARIGEPAFDRIDPLVEAVAAAVGPHLDRPYAVFGHSMGAVVGFEVARRLRHLAGKEPAHLFVCGYNAPRSPRLIPSVANLTAPELSAALRRIGGTPEAVLADDEVMEVMAPLLRADFGVCETYVYRPGPPLGGPVTAYAGADDEFVTWHGLDGWRAETTGRFQIRLAPGGHFLPQTDPAAVTARLAADLAAPPEAVPPRSADGEVQVWRVDLAQPAEVVGRLAATLSADERDRAARFVRDRDRVGYVVARGAVRSVLGRYAGVPAGDCRFGYGPHGKPHLAHPAGTGLEFNLSHADGLGLLAVARDRAVGVDVEAVRADVDVSGVAGTAFSAAERAALAARPPADQVVAFHELWTRKEAVLKCAGVGLGGTDPTTVTVPARGSPPAPGGLAVATLSPAAGYAGAVAVAGGYRWLSCATWQPPV